jgi:two-component system phosphate regulon sensor histidine kinase PhoR
MHVPPHKSVVVSFEDVTAIEEAGQMRRDFVANVSHELRTPLTALLGFVETLRGAARNDPAARDRFLQIMEREAGRMARLVEDLLSLSRVEDNERLRPTDPVDLSALVNATTTLLAPVAATAGVVLQTDLPAGPVVVPGDAGQLRQVLNNLIENAIKYGISGGRVLVSVAVAAPDAALRANGVRLTVQDWGEGIAAHHIPRLTERFYRIDTHRSREIGGTGLGLAIVKHIVNRHRGRLRIDSAPGKGTVLTLILPTG